MVKIVSGIFNSLHIFANYTREGYSSKVRELLTLIEYSRPKNMIIAKIREVSNYGKHLHRKYDQKFKHVEAEFRKAGFNPRVLNGLMDVIRTNNQSYLKKFEREHNLHTYKFYNHMDKEIFFLGELENRQNILHKLANMKDFNSVNLEKLKIELKIA